MHMLVCVCCRTCWRTDAVLCVYVHHTHTPTQRSTGRPLLNSIFYLTQMWRLATPTSEMRANNARHTHCHIMLAPQSTHSNETRVRAVSMGKYL